MEMEDVGGMAVAFEVCGSAAALGGDVGRWFKIAAVALGAAAAEEHATMTSASASSKPRAYITTLASVLARMAREDVSDARDVCWQ
jgi:hypothetical protein